MTRAEARAQRATAVEKRRHAEALCAWDFRVNGDLHGEHAKRCVQPGGVVCSREYDPGPVPNDERMYEGTELGTLWGLNDIATWQLAGWDITRPRRVA